MSLPRRAVDVRAVLLAGLAGTAAMTLSTAAESRWRAGSGRPVNYDASEHVATAVGTVLRRPPTTVARRRTYTVLAHWGYGSAVAVLVPALGRDSRPGTATALALTATTQAMASVLFPVLGGTPPPWRWSASTTVSSLVHHLVYSVVATAVWRSRRPIRSATVGTAPA